MLLSLMPKSSKNASVSCLRYSQIKCPVNYVREHHELIGSKIRSEKDRAYEAIFFRLILLIGIMIGPPAISVPEKFNTAIFVFPSLMGRKFCDKFAEGDRYFSKGQLLKAIDSYKNLLLANSDSCLQKSDVYARCAWMYYLQENWPKAEYFTSLRWRALTRETRHFRICNLDC